MSDEQIDIRQLNAQDALSFSEMTYKNVQACLNDLQSEIRPNLHALGAYVNGKPAGLIVAEGAATNCNAYVYSIYVEPGHRGNGIAGMLLRAMEEIVRQHGYKQLELVYFSNLSSVVSLERVLQKCQWPTSQATQLVFRTTKDTTRAMLQDRMFNHQLLQKEYSLFSWQELTQGERAIIQENEGRENWHPSGLSPFHDESRLERLNSVGLKYKGDVVGWMITHRVAPDTIRYSSLFVRRDLQTIGRAAPVLAESMRRHIELGYPQGITNAILFVNVHNVRMLEFVKRRISPYLYSTSEKRVATKGLPGIVCD